ncbi:MAG TPA: hypothetical protein VJ914_23930 [Pseudonocardiaceae bacterium]|nr:hypothetical protein [Pseudonocardiaceae bacterium]
MDIGQLVRAERDTLGWPVRDAAIHCVQSHVANLDRLRSRLRSRL